MIQIRADAFVGNKTHPLPIGRLGENLVRTMVFDLAKIKENYGDGEWIIVAQRPFDKCAYIVGNVWESAEGYACWDVNNYDVGVAGNGFVELRYYPEADKKSIYKTRLWVTKISDSVESTFATHDPYESLIDEIREDFVIIKELKKTTQENADLVTEKASQVAENTETVTRLHGEVLTAAEEVENNTALVRRLAGDVDANTKTVTKLAAEAKENADTTTSALENVQQLISDGDVVTLSQIGEPGGIAKLDDNGIVDQRYLPSSFDDIAEYAATTDFPATGETGKIYFTSDMNSFYRWDASSSSYKKIAVGLTLGTTSSTAYRGDRGKIAYDHSQSAHFDGDYNSLTNKPTIGDGVLTIKKNGVTVGTFSANSETNNEIDIPVQDGSAQVQADWTETDTTNKAYINNKPDLGSISALNFTFDSDTGTFTMTD